MNRMDAEQLLEGGMCLMADNQVTSLVVKQLEDGTFIIVTIDYAHKRSHTQTSETVETTLAVMEAFTSLEAWHETDEM